MPAFVPLDGQEPEDDLEHIEVSTAFDELSKEFVDGLIDKIIVFIEALSGNPFHDYQKGFARRIVESCVIRDAEVVTALASRQCLDGDTVVFRRDGTAIRLREHEDAWSTGVKPTKRYRVSRGAEIIATDNHPVMTDRGWVPAGHLKVGDKVATLAEWDQWGDVSPGANRARLLGYMITDGTGFLQKGQSPKFTNTRSAYLDEVELLAKEEFGISAKRYIKGSGFDLLLTGDRGSAPNPVRAWMLSHDLDHGFPTAVFAWKRRDVGEFINRAWAGDGCVRYKTATSGNPTPEVFLACGNDEVYARYWQALLAKLGITSTVKRELLPKGTGTFHRLMLGSSAENVRRFFDVTGDIFGKEEQSRKVRAALPAVLDEASEDPGCPGYQRHKFVLGRVPGRSAAAPSGSFSGKGLPCVRCGWVQTRRGVGRSFTRPRTTDQTGIDGEQFSYQKIVSIEDAGEREVFDVEYPGKGWFVAGLAYVHNSGKSETVANTVAGLMVILPRLAQMFPKLLGVYKGGFWVGLFAPVEGQVETLYSRVISRLTSERALEILSDPEIDDKMKRIAGVTKGVRLEKSGSFCMMMTANPKAKIESKTFHLVIIDEAQDSDDVVVSKSISPMLAHYKGCLDGDARILMEDGTLVRIEDLVREKPVGARVLSPATEDLTDGVLVPRLLEGFHDNGEEPTLKVTLRGGREIIATHNHKFVRAHNLRSDRNSWNWTRADALRVGDRIAVPWQPVTTGKPVESTLPELLGWIISEGCVTGVKGSHTGPIEIAQTVPDLVSDITSLVGAYDDNLRFDHEGRRGRVHTKRHSSRPNTLKRELIRLGVWGKSASQKRIPEECFGWDNQSICRLLSRLYAGDGCLHNGTTVPVIKYTTISRGLATDLLLLLDRIGVYATYNTSVVPQTGNIAYHIVVTDPVSQQRFLESVGWMKASNDFPGFVARLDRRCKSRTDLGMRYEKVASIEDAGVRHTYDVQVAESHCYIANGIVSHNTMVKTGTPTFTKNNFYKSIQLNKRVQTGRGVRQAHFQWDWKDVVKEVPDYGDFIKKEILRVGEDSDEFQMSFCCKFILERGMFVTQTQMDELSDTSMETVKAYHNTPCVVGIDPARKQDSTVVTVVYVDWDRPDEFGYFHHRVLNWLEIQGDDWEAQYHQIVDFLGHYNVLAIGVDANGVGDAVAQRLALLIPRAEVIPLTSSQQEQSDRFKHLQALIQRQQIAWPGNAKARRLRTWKRFMQQMTDAEKQFKGTNFMVAAPDEPHAHDDYVDSLAIACALTKDLTLPTVQVARNPFFA